MCKCKPFYLCSFILHYVTKRYHNTVCECRLGTLPHYCTLSLHFRDTLHSVDMIHHKLTLRIVKRLLFTKKIRILPQP